MKNPKVSIILLNMNQPALTIACLRSLQQCTYPNIEIIVVDQASKDDSVELIGKQFPMVKLIANKINNGFTGGNNTGMREAAGDYFFLLNNDTEVDPGFLEPLIEELELNQLAGAASPLIRFFQNPDKIQYAGGPESIDLIRGKNSWRGWMSNYPTKYAFVEPTSAAHGAAFIVKRKVAEEVGLLDDNFFIYFEELDWSIRIRKAGYKILFVPASEIFHKESMTMPKEHPFRVRFMTCNRILLSRKHLTKFRFFKSLIYSTLISLPGNCLRYLFGRKTELFKAYTSGFYQGLINH